MKTFFERELSKILCYVPKINFYDWHFIDGKRAYCSYKSMKFKVEFAFSFAIDKYDEIVVTAINPNSSEVDRLYIKFADVIGKIPTNNPNFTDGLSLSTWKDRSNYGDCQGYGWYVVRPTEEHYKLLAEKIGEYIMLFSE